METWKDELDKVPDLSWGAARKIQLDLIRKVEQMQIKSGNPRFDQQEAAFELNNRRTREGLAKLTLDDALAEIARLKAARGLR